MKQIPYISTDQKAPTLYVDGKPFLSIGGELHNSSASSTRYMQEKVWPNLRALNANSIVATVSWEQIEPEENVFCFTIVDELIRDARKENLRLILIWFGLWKNGESSYVPSWVKRQPEKYWKCVRPDGSRLTTYFSAMGANTISPLCLEAVDADAKAYSALMRHIREIDEDYTVIMMQVENEIGLMGSARDFSIQANERFKDEIPESVAKAYGVSGSWKSAFHDDAEEYFMAWHYACAVEKIASAGAKEHPLPAYVNAWLQQYPDRAGAYPSGGPIAKVMPLWRLAAPTICLYAPDIYLPDFEKVLEEYSRDGNPIFIPETRSSIASAATIFLALGKYNAFGFHPFGIEDVLGSAEAKLDMAELAALNIDLSAFHHEGSAQYLPESYKLLINMADVICRYRGTDQMTGFYQYGDQEGSVLPFSKYDLHVTYGRKQPGIPPSGGLVIEVSPDEFILAGINFRAEFLPKKGDPKFVDYIMLQEGEFVNNEWMPGRILNGDERRIKLQDKPQVLRVELYQWSHRND